MEWQIIVPVAAALLGAGLGGFITYFVQVKMQQTEDRRHLSSVALEIALSEWRRRSEMQRNMPPMLDFVIFYTPQVEGLLILSRGGMNTGAMRGLLRQCGEQTDEFLGIKDSFIRRTP